MTNQRCQSAPLHAAAFDQIRNAEDVVDRLPGGSQSILVRDSFNDLWVVKFKSNPQHSRLPINEYLATRLLETIGLSVPRCAFISVGADLASKISTDTPGGTRIYEPGLHFGSRFVLPNAGDRAWSTIPPAAMSRVVNLSERLGILAFDTWVDNTDRREAVYAPVARRSRQVRATWIDHGACFGDATWDLRFYNVRRSTRINSILRCVTSFEDFEPWLGRIESFPDATLDQIANELPVEWTQGEEVKLLGLLQQLKQRRSRLRTLLVDAICSSKGLFAAWPEDPRDQPKAPTLSRCALATFREPPCQAT